MLQHCCHLTAHLEHFDATGLDALQVEHIVDLTGEPVGIIQGNFQQLFALGC